MTAISGARNYLKIQSDTPSDPPSEETPAPPKSAALRENFAEILAGIAGGESAAEVSEEELFAALVQERVAAVKGDETAVQFKQALDTASLTPTRYAGHIAWEDAATSALQSMVSSDALTVDEANKIYSEAFDAAQLDANTDMVWDNMGGANDPSIAVDTMDAALTAARLKITSFADGTAAATERSFFFENDAGLVGTDPADLPAPGDVAEPQGTQFDGSGGFLFKPISANQGRLAVLLPPSLKYLVDSVVLKDESGNELDRGTSYGYGDTGEREKFSFSKKGGEYPPNLTVEVALMDGTSRLWKIPDPSKRYD